MNFFKCNFLFSRAKPVFVLPFIALLLALPLLNPRATSDTPPNISTPLSPTSTLLLYDAASGTVPAAPLMNFFDVPPGAASPFYENGATVLDTTTLGNGTYAGWLSEGTITPGFPILDRENGFQVDFTVEVENESHANNNRAGFSVIALGSDAKGIEIAFWEDEIWAQNDNATGGLFTHGEGAVFTTTTSLIAYQLILVSDTYTLTANTLPILSGPVRDYSDFNGFPDPYETPNFLFFGDDTTSAQGRIRLTYVSVTGTDLPTPTPTVTATATPSPTATLLPPITPSPTPEKFPNQIFLPIIFWAAPNP